MPELIFAQTDTSFQFMSVWRLFHLCGAELFVAARLLGLLWLQTHFDHIHLTTDNPIWICFCPFVRPNFNYRERPTSINCLGHVRQTYLQGTQNTGKTVLINPYPLD